MPSDLNALRLYLHKPTGKWYLYRGRRYVRSTGETDLIAATKALIEEQAAEAAQDGRKGFTLRDGADLYLETLKGPDRPQRAHQNARTFLENQILPLLGPSTPMGEIAVQDVERFIASRRAVGVSASTLRRYVGGILSPMWALAAERGHIRENVIAKVKKPPAGNGRAVYLTPKEYRSLLICSDVPWCWWLQVMVNTGMRPGESFQLTWGDIRLEESPAHLVVRPRQDPETGKLLRVKDGKRRLIPLNAIAIEALACQREWLDSQKWAKAVRRRRDGDPPCLWVFPTREGKRRQDPRSVGEPWSRWVKRAKLERIGDDRLDPYCLRHTYACWFLKATEGAGLYQLSRSLGHSSVRTTERNYLHLVATDFGAGTSPLEAVFREGF